MTDSNNTQTIVELYVRALYVPGAQQRQDRVVEALNKRVKRGDIDGFSVVVWGEHITPDTDRPRTETGQSLVDRLNEFQQWALDENVSLTSFYRSRCVETMVSETEQTVISLPMMGLAEYADDNLVQLTPCTDDGTVKRVEDHLTELGPGVVRQQGLEAEQTKTNHDTSESSQGNADD